MNKLAMLALVSLVMGTSIQSCKKSNTTENPEPEHETEKTFSVGGLVMDPDGSYLFQNSTLSTGEISFLGKGANVTSQEPGFLAFMVKDGYYYSYQSSENTLTKYRYVNQKLETVKVIPFVLAEGYRYNHQWIDNSNLLIYGYQGAYKIVNVESM
ncbi:hypothetical protein, partial [Sphingobacterium sp.]|uniref:hypothetical protein n=1 Tax=Sphingobacterium sp. TaxID=341027 RepID=UPI00289C815A